MGIVRKITYAGHSAFFVRYGDFVVAIDPWLENPLCPPHLRSPERIDLIVLTHGHSDHAGNCVELANRYKSKVTATYELAVILVDEGVPHSQVIQMNKGGTIRWNDLSVSLTHAMHSSSYDGKNGTVYAGEPCGVVLKDEKSTVYHAGDTALFSDMKLIGDQYQPNVAILPIGDCFTMGPSEAAKAASFIGARIAIPCHYATFPPLTGTASEFEAECKKRGVSAITLEPGASYELG